MQTNTTKDSKAVKSFCAIAVFLFFSCRAFAEVRVAGASVPVDFYSNVEQYLKVTRYVTIDRKNWTKSEFTDVDENNTYFWTPPGSIHALEEMKKLEDLTPKRKSIVRRYVATSKQVYNFTYRNDWINAVEMRIQAIAQIKLMNTNKHYYYPPTPNDEISKITNESFTTTSTNFWKNKSGAPSYYDQYRGSPYEAILDICDIKNTTYGECNGALHVCIWYGAAIANESFPFDKKHTPNLLEMSKNGVSSDALRVHLELPNVDSDPKTLVPGDWVYMVNHNYNDLIKPKHGFVANGWMKDEMQYFFSGENFLFVGEENGQDLFEGLGMGPMTESAARKLLLDGYNATFQVLFDKHAKTKDGRAVVPLTEDDANGLIVFQAFKRIKP